MDYLLRDSYHAGVHYGKFDSQRLISTMTAMAVKGGSPRVGIQEGGWHAAEALVIARYFMFTQVYFHKTRVAYDIHLREAMKELLPQGHFPPPERLEEFIMWDDWRVLGLLASGGGGEHGRRLSSRQHYRVVFQTNEVQTPVDKERSGRARAALGPLLAADMPAAKNWYKTGVTDIRIENQHTGVPVPLSVRSSVVRNLGTNDQVLLYCSPENRAEADMKVKEAVDPMQLSLGEITFKCLCAFDRKKRVVLPPYDERARLLAAKVPMPGVVKRDIRLVVMKQFELNGVIVEGVLKVSYARGIAVTESGIIRSDHMKFVRELGY